MNACIKHNTTAPTDHEIERTMSQLVPQVHDLLHRITNTEPDTSKEQGYRMMSPLGFPDGVGEGWVAAELFRYRDAVRLDIRIDHNRVFADPAGGPTERRCFLNDYIASVTLAVGADTIPAEFVRTVVAGITAARDAVRRHNKQSAAPWAEIRVAAASLQGEPVA
jgi:hypothetical protein